MRLPRLCSAAIAGLSLGACEIPTEAPIVEQRWMLPLDEVTLHQDQLLPPAVTTDGAVYDVSIDPIRVSGSLGSLCAACSPSAAPAPVPAYRGGFVTLDGLPAEVVAVDVASGTIELTITNGLAFDPLQGGGTVTITVAGAGGGPVLGALLLDGATLSMPPGSVIRRTISLATGTVRGALETTVEVDSPGGQIASVDLADEVTLDAVVTSLRASAATVDVAGRTVTLTETPLDVEGIDSVIIDGITDSGGAVLLEVTNPFGVTFDGSITVGPVVKAVSVDSAPASSITIRFSGDELRSFLGHPSISYSGSGALGGGPAVVTPASRMVIDATIDVTVAIGG